MKFNSYDDLTSDLEFDILCRLIQDDGVSQILTIPGVYEVVREHFNNEILKIFEEEYMEYLED